jgi:hypothetical protein
MKILGFYASMRNTDPIVENFGVGLTNCKDNIGTIYLTHCSYALPASGSMKLYV